MSNGTIEAMATYGGSFVKALAACFRAADEQNRAKLFVAFEDVFEEYEEIALQADRRRRLGSEIANG